MALNLDMSFVLSLQRRKEDIHDPHDRRAFQGIRKSADTTKQDLLGTIRPNITWRF